MSDSDNETTQAPPIITFFRLIEQARLPQRADRAAWGTLPIRAARYCDAVTQASAFGWYLFPPLDFALMWDGSEIFWSYGDVADWMPLEAAQYPDFAARFDAVAPDAARGCSPPFLTALPEPGVVQLWSGMIARTAPDWSLLVRGLANVPHNAGFTLYEGIIESDRWFGPLFTNIRLTRTHSPVQFRSGLPIAQLQPLPRHVYGDATLGAAEAAPSLDDLGEREWADYIATVVKHNDDPDRAPGRYAVAARKRRKSGGCPVAHEPRSEPHHHNPELHA